MAKRAVTAAPLIDALRLANLVDGEAALLRPHESYDGQRFTASDVSEDDLSGISFTECELIELEANETNFRAATFVETRFEKLNAPIFAAPRSNLRDVSIEGSRLGSAEFYESTWKSIRFVHCRIGYLNLRGAHLQDVLFDDCLIDELDLGGATANRVAFTNTQVNTLDLTRAKLTNVDLRSLELRHVTGVEHLKGATINSYQLTELAPALAAHLGIVLDD
ncbi:pentapeptide repeat-containing protein [Salinibacterium sp. SWN1162]|uniref:pentapeptide repeat-containing protein n=1 Tax=Salinibacterium sp. SWN1162 TaxID=2792053 RepID=UPI0018CC9879|nr:pentapeptide repeat-containing protein [Salinibacterium sp. SWN1162]MBH0010281.1 pentapeptide repeat-containing protein [Salinibacterium sp. SWN1162]